MMSQLQSRPERSIWLICISFLEFPKLIDTSLYHFSFCKICYIDNVASEKYFICLYIRLKEENEFLISQHQSKVQMMEQEKSEQGQAYLRRQEMWEAERQAEIDRLREQHRFYNYSFSISK